MSITSVTFKYPVAKVMDSPWNTIINGLNYTKTNLSPVPLKNGEAYHPTNGMILAQSAYCAIPTVSVNPTSRSYTWSGGARDSKDVNSYWMTIPVCDRGWGYGDFGSGSPTLSLLKKEQDDSGRTYTNIINQSLSTKYSSWDIVYQTNDYLYVMYQGSPASSSGGGYIYLGKWRKSESGISVSNYVRLDSTYTLDWLYLGNKNGKLYFVSLVSDNSNYSDTRICVYSYNLSTDKLNVEYKKNMSSDYVGLAYSDIQNNELYYMDLRGGSYNNGYYYPKMYKITFDSNWSNPTEKEITVTEGANENTYSNNLDSGEGPTRLKVFLHSYEIEGEKYLLKINVKNNSFNTNNEPFTGDSVKFYKIVEDSLVQVSSFNMDIYNIIPKNNWNTVFAACNTGVRVLSLDSNSKNIIEQPEINLNLYQFGFDTDERLWVLSREGTVYRYNYNQPATLLYSFEKERYPLQGSSPLDSFVKVSVANYMGEHLNMTVTLQAVGNFNFQGGQKELQIALDSQNETQIPVVITGAGTYQLILK